MTAKMHRQSGSTRVDQSGSMRLDKWLWCARWYKSRGLARDAIGNGRVREHGRRIKPARSIRPGDRLEIRRGPFTYVLTITSLATTRLPAREAAGLYEEHPDSIASREQLAMEMKTDKARVPRPRARPDKRERRELIRFIRERG